VKDIIEKMRDELVAKTPKVIENLSIKPVNHPSQKNASAFGGDATPPGTFMGALVKKNVYRPSLLATSLNLSRSHSSPIGIPQPASSH
jgi:hypothetical protein